MAPALQSKMRCCWRLVGCRLLSGLLMRSEVDCWPYVDGIDWSSELQTRSERPTPSQTPLTSAQSAPPEEAEQPALSPSPSPSAD
jgi:hypothetical protein